MARKVNAPAKKVQEMKNNHDGVGKKFFSINPLN